MDQSEQRSQCGEQEDFDPSDEADGGPGVTPPAGSSINPVSLYAPNGRSVGSGLRR
jgi:hypothetical protein